MQVIKSFGPMPALPVARESDFFDACERLWKRYRAWRLRRATERALEALGDGALRDIGIHRCEIASLAAGNDRTRRR
jgi:uncharacterized protein YjiS (DUF1127 family)